MWEFQNPFKICVIGNSHVGALKLAWDIISEQYPGIGITFFAQRASGMRALIVQDRKLVPSSPSLLASLRFTSGGKEFIDPQDYDIILLYALGSGEGFSGNDRFFSKAVKLTALQDRVSQSLSFKILQQVRELTDKLVFLANKPLRSAKVDSPVGHAKHYLERIDNINQLIYSPLNAELLAQPAETIVNDRFTHPVFSRGSRRMAIGISNDEETHPEGDLGHMNSEFGKIWMRHFLNRLHPEW